MDDIKTKVIKFVKKQEMRKDEEAEDSDTIRQSAVVRPKPLETEIDELEDDEVLKQLPEFYFNEDFDVQHYILKGLPPELKCGEIKVQLRTLYRQHGVVSKKTLRQILEKESLCQGELERVGEVLSEISVALEACQKSRAQINGFKNKFTDTCLGLLRNVKRKQVLGHLLVNLRTIRTLQKSEDKVQSLLSEGDFPSAIRLLLECQGVANGLKHFKCVSQLCWKLQDIVNSTETCLDSTLSQMCKNFDEVTYTNLQEAYELLDKTQTLMDQFLMHFTSEIHTSAFQVVHGFVPSASTKHFQHLCKIIPSKDYVICLQNLCQEIWRILYSFYRVFMWHQQREKQHSEAPGRDFEKSLNKQYVKQKLDKGQSRLWNDVQTKITSYILGHDFSDCKFEDLLQILGMLHRMIEIGEEFCGSKSEEITKCIRQQTVNYFQSYHAAKLEELRIFLENEVWTPCPVRHTFNLTQLQEFKTLRHAIESQRKPKRDLDGKDSETRTSNSNLSTEGSSSIQNYFSRYHDRMNSTPFDGPLDETYQEDILEIGEDLSGYYSDSSDETDSEELKKAFVDDNPNQESAHRKKKPKTDSKKKLTCPLVANTTLTVLRQCGKYLQMCRLLKPIALDVVMCMCQLFDYYLYNVFHFFTSDLPVQSTSMVSFKLNAALKRIEENLLLKEEQDRRRVVASHLSEMVNLNTKESLYGLAERTVGVESLIFLGKQFEYIEPYVIYLVPEEKRHFIHQFYSQTVACVPDLRRPAYMCVSAHVVDMRATIKEIEKVNFNVSEITSQHSAYVDKIVRDMQIFSMKLEECEIDIPNEAEVALWENVLHVVNNILVEGFSIASTPDEKKLFDFGKKKCNDSGRALMLLDYTQLVSKVQKITPLKKMPNKEFVENYIKAYYIQETMLEEWMNQHREYTPDQLKGLVHCVSQNEKTRKYLLQMLKSAR